MALLVGGIGPLHREAQAPGDSGSRGDGPPLPARAGYSGSQGQAGHGWPGRGYRVGQGTAADIIKRAMVRMEPALREAGLAARMLLQVRPRIPTQHRNATPPPSTQFQLPPHLPPPARATRVASSALAPVPSPRPPCPGFCTCYALASFMDR